MGFDTAKETRPRSLLMVFSYNCVPNGEMGYDAVFARRIGLAEIWLVIGPRKPS